MEEVTPLGPAVTWLDMRPASLRLDASPEGASTFRQGLPSGPVVEVVPSGPVLVETEPPGPELEEDELDAAQATPIVPTANMAAAHIESDERGIGWALSVQKGRSRLMAETALGSLALIMARSVLAVAGSRRVTAWSSGR